MGALVDRRGQTYGHLLVLERAGGGGHGRHVRWRCRCDCGGLTVVSGSNLQTGATTSCGCREGSWSHRQASSPEYRSWRSMKNRCLNPKTDGFEHYGGRGISVCARWLDSFESFLADLGPRPDGCSLDRINVDGDYEPGNCRWATHAEQRANTRAANFAG